MKKIIASIAAGAMVLSLAACGNSGSTETTAATTAAPTTAAVESTEAVTTAAVETPETITITTLNASKEEVELEVPYNPERIAILDLAALDILDAIGVGDRVVGMADTSIDYLQSYANDDSIANLGNVKEADLEATMECEPDIIFIGGRLSTVYDDLSAIAPVVYLETDTTLGVVESVKKNATTIASIFGLESEIEEMVAAFDSRIEALAAVAEGKTALIGMVTSGSFNLLGNSGRCSIIGKEIGFTNLTGDTEESGGSERGGSGQGGSGRGGQGGSGDAGSPHGNESSFELVVQQNPDYIFVLDRDSAIGTEGAQLAQDVMDNELINGTSAYQNGQIVYLEHPAVWYTAEGGISALDIMLQDLESVLLQ